MRERGAVLKRGASARPAAAVPRAGAWVTAPARRGYGAPADDEGQPRALRDAPFEFFHWPMLSVMIFTEESAAWVACA
jgi:hypothetical protein